MEYEGIKIIVNASFFKVVYTLAIVARASLLIAKSSSSVEWSCPKTARWWFNLKSYSNAKKGFAGTFFFLFIWPYIVPCEVPCVTPYIAPYVAPYIAPLCIFSSIASFRSTALSLSSSRRVLVV